MSQATLYSAKLEARSLCGHTFLLRLRTPEGFRFEPGDSVKIYPENDPERMARVCELLGCKADLSDKSIQHVTAKFLRMARPFARNPEEIDALLSLGRITDRFVPLWEVLEACPGISPELCLSHLSPLLPRFYSIASADRTDFIDLIVAVNTSVTWRGEEMKGMCTDYLLERADEVRLELHSADHFRLPDNPKSPIIMFGPGTGVAPFRAFLHTRTQSNAGENWLFFGARHKSSDFYYGDELLGLEAEGKLRLTTAFSRDGAEKIYVQDRLEEEADRFIDWIERGAHVYICGDAKKMARAVQERINAVGSSRGYEHLVKTLRKEGRLSLDVY